jgi:hypothetical protein
VYSVLIVLEDVYAKLISIEHELLEFVLNLHLLARVLHNIIDDSLIKGLP